MSRVWISLLSVSMAVSACSPSKPAAPKTSVPVVAKPAPPKPRLAPPQPPEDPSKLDRRWEITVLAGNQDRDAQLITVRLPRTRPVMSAQVREPSGAKVVAQIQAPGVVAFRSKPIKAGGTAVYLVEEDAKPGKPDRSGMQAAQSAEGIKLTLNNRPVLTYVSRPQIDRKDVPPAAARGGYLHPLYSPAGVLVTDDFPQDKPFQHGIWTAWQKVESAGSHADFWDLTKGKGRVAVESIGSVWGGPLAAGFDARHYFTDFDQRKGMTVLREAWEVSASRGADRYTLVDLYSAQESINGPATLGANPFGGVMVRGSRDWQGGKSIFMTSEGHDRGKAMGATARWCYLGGKSGGKQAGIAILSHPANPKAPEALYIDPVDPVMGFAPTQKEPRPMPPHAMLRLRYRTVVLDGAPDSKLLDKLWNEYANPPETQLRVLKNE